MLKTVLNFFEILRLKSRHRRLASNDKFVGTIRMAHNKPPVFVTRPFELFYRSRMFWMALQMGLLISLLLWTIKNYIHVFRTLF